MKYLSRNKAYQKVQPSRDARKIYIFCEGEKKEISYFKYFQGLSSNIEIIPIPSVNGHSDPIKLMENASRIFLGEIPELSLGVQQDDEVWFVIDTDRWNENNKIEIIQQFCSTHNNKEALVYYVAQSNPCFEIWLYYHFFDVLPEEAEIAQAESFKHFVAKKISGGFDNRTMPVEIQTAIVNAESNFVIENNQPRYLSTEVFKLGKVLLPYIKHPLDLILKASL